ncbi:MAG: RNA methyltransferase [Actinomycetota bacterium]
MTEPIIVDDAGDPRLAEFRLNERGLASRAEKRDDSGAGLFLAEGDLVVERALDAGCVPHAALVDADAIPDVAHRLGATGAPVFAGGDGVRRMVSQLGMPQPVIALFRRPARPMAEQLAADTRRLVVVEGVDNPANVGAIVRNASGLGWDGLLLDHTSADPLARRSLRVAMGTAFQLPHARTQRLTSVLTTMSADPDVDLLALTPSARATPIDAVEPAGEGRRRAIVLGSERDGLSDDLLGLATPVRIPMSGDVDSLNVAAATAIACWALR